MLTIEQIALEILGDPVNAKKFKIKDEKGKLLLQQARRQGTRGTAFLAQLADGTDVFCKISEDKTSKDTLTKESVRLGIMRGAKYSVQIKDTINLNGGKVIIALEKGDKDLQEKIAEGIGYNEFVPIVGQLCNSLIEIESRNVSHRDIKPENALFFGNLLKMGDFTESGFIGSGSTIVMKGTASYLPPEVLSARKIKDEKLNKFRDAPTSSVYSLGMVILEMVTNNKPYSDIALNDDEDYNEVVAKKMDPKDLDARLALMDAPIKAKQTPGFMKGIAKRCSNPEPARRYQSVKDVKKALSGYSELEKVYVELKTALEQAKPTQFAGIANDRFAVYDIETANKVVELKERFDRVVLESGIGTVLIEDGKDSEGNVKYLELNTYASREQMLSLSPAKEDLEVYSELKHPDMKKKLEALDKTLKNTNMDDGVLQGRINEINKMYLNFMGKIRSSAKALCPHHADEISGFYALDKTKQESELAGLMGKNDHYMKNNLGVWGINESKYKEIKHELAQLVDICTIF